MKPILYKKDKKIICYIKQINGIYVVRTGKPSDATCIGWHYNNLKDAEFTANEYFKNRTNFFNK